MSNPTVRIMFAKQNVRRQVGEFRLMKESAEQAASRSLTAPATTGRPWCSPRPTSTTRRSSPDLQRHRCDRRDQYMSKKLGGSNNPYGFSNKQVDDLYEQLQVTTDPTKQDELLKQVDKPSWWTTPADHLPVPEHDVLQQQAAGHQPIAITPTIFWNFWREAQLIRGIDQMLRA